MTAEAAPTALTPVGHAEQMTKFVFVAPSASRVTVVDQKPYPDRVAAAQRSRNLAAFLDQVHAFEPVEG